MESVIEQIINTGPMGVVCASIVYLIIHFQRKSTGEKRDSQNEDLQTRIALLENEMKQIKQLDLDARLAAIETSLKYIEKLLEDSRK